MGCGLLTCPRGTDYERGPLMRCCDLNSFANPLHGETDAGESRPVGVPIVRYFPAIAQEALAYLKEITGFEVQLSLSLIVLEDAIFTVEIHHMQGLVLMQRQLAMPGRHEAISERSSGEVGLSATKDLRSLAGQFKAFTHAFPIRGPDDHQHRAGSRLDTGARGRDRRCACGIGGGERGRAASTPVLLFPVFFIRRNHLVSQRPGASSRVIHTRSR